MLLSYPVKKWWLLLSKFVTNLFVFFVIYAAVTTIDVLLVNLSPFEPMLYVTFASILVQLTFLCSTAMIISLLLRSEIASILTSIILFLGIEIVGSSNNNILSFYVRHQTIFRFFEQTFHNITTEITFQETLTALVLPIVVSTLFLLVSFLYFDRKMELD
jgi:ABC-type transport system involved in multi-copper enzyme maturation permease subunit